MFLPVSTALQHSPHKAEVRIHEMPDGVTLQIVLSKPQHTAAVSIKKKMT